jgi:hypothetical protein
MRTDSPSFRAIHKQKENRGFPQPAPPPATERKV